MPIYEYQCEKCEHEFEREQRITDPPVKTCPKCRSRKVKKLISRTSFVLKGSGWYSDLYSSAKPDGKKDSDASSTDASSTTDTKTESKSGKAKDAASKPASSSDKSDAKGRKGKGKSAA